MATAGVLAPPKQIPVTRRRFTAREYYTMLDAGILHEDDRLELIEGEIVEMSPINPTHASHVKRLNALFQRRLGERALLGVQDPLDLGEHSQPQPDVLVLKLRQDFYRHSHPAPADVFLIVEVSDSTVAYDRDVKAPLYAKAGAQEMWLINLPEKCLEVYQGPGPDGYRTRHRLTRADEELALSAFPDVVFRLSEILGDA